MPNLKHLLLLDAVSCAGMGALLLIGAPPIEAWTSIPSGLLIAAGILLLPTALFMALIAARHSGNAAAVWTVVLGNAGWVAASLVVVAAGPIQPNALGIAFILTQAAFVAVLALLEYAVIRTGNRTIA